MSEPGLGQVYQTLLEMKEGQGRLEGKVDAAHEKLIEHVQDKDLHAGGGGIRLETPHVVGISGVLTSIGAFLHWVSGLIKPH